MTDPIAALHARYRASFPEKRAELQAALSRWRDAPASADAMAQLYLLTHKLAGSAGAYGFDGLATLARTADRLLQPHARGGVALTPNEIAPIDAAVVALAAALASD
jgi:HPt (histidine-containing phosphotransfer) domain-containing protein